MILQTINYLKNLYAHVVAGLKGEVLVLEADLHSAVAKAKADAAKAEKVIVG